MPRNAPNNLSPKQEKAIVALLNEHSVTKAAQAVKVCEKTIYRWLDEPHFAAAYRKARREAFGQAIAMTQRYAPLAVHTLAQVMTDPKSPTTAKVNAASTILRFGREGIELDDLAVRVEALEEAARVKGQPP